MAFFRKADPDAAALEDWERDLTAKDGHPLIAIILVAIIILIGTFGGTHDGRYAGESLAFLVGGAIGLTILVYGLAWVITIRHASVSWQVGSLAGIALLCVFATTTRIELDNAVIRRDLLMLAEIEITDDGQIKLPPNADRGPVSRIFLRYFKTLNDIGQEQTSKLDAIGINRIAAPGIEDDPSLLKDCARFGREKPAVDARVARIRAAARQVGKDIGTADIPVAARREISKGMADAIDPAIARINNSATIVKAQLDEGQAICQTLARRNWRAQGTRLMFTNQSDLASFNHHIERWNQLVRDNQAALAEGKRMVTEGQRIMKRWNR